MENFIQAIELLAYTALLGLLYVGVLCLVDRR
jgi:hypothetical protein